MVSILGFNTIFIISLDLYYCFTKKGILLGQKEENPHFRHRESAKKALWNGGIAFCPPNFIRKPPFDSSTLPFTHLRGWFEIGFGYLQRIKKKN